MLGNALGEMLRRSFIGRKRCYKRCEVTLPLEVTSHCLQPVDNFSRTNAFFTPSDRLSDDIVNFLLDRLNLRAAPVFSRA
jgi:hypothetical protein